MDEEEFEDDNDIDDQDVDDILDEDEDIVEEKAAKALKKSKYKDKAKLSKPTHKSKEQIVPTEEFKWHKINQPAFEGWQNSDTGEIIDGDEAIRRMLCYAEEAAMNTR